MTLVRKLKRINRSFRLSERSDYKGTWQSLSTSLDSAKMAVSGFTDEASLEFHANYTLKILERTVGLRPSDIVLEIGCGIGRVGKVISPRCARWIGTDISANMLVYAADRLKGVPNAEFVELSTVGLGEIADESVDLVYCTVVFMHLFEWDRWRYVSEAFRVLKPGGRCFFDNVDIASDHGWNVLLEGAKFLIESRMAHVSMTSSGDELETYAKRAGFGAVQIHRWDNAWVAVTGVKPEPASAGLQK